MSPKKLVPRRVCPIARDKAATPCVQKDFLLYTVEDFDVERYFAK
jgi:hypothetical protein